MPHVEVVLNDHPENSQSRRSAPSYFRATSKASPPDAAACRFAGPAPEDLRYRCIDRACVGGFCCILVLPVQSGRSRGMTRRRQATQIRRDQDAFPPA